MRATDDLLRAAYAAFNARDLDGALATMHPDVRWPNGWEGGIVHGRDGVRDYWTRQWAVLDPHVEPLAIEPRDDGRFDVLVHQLVRDRAGRLVSEGDVRHVYLLEDGLIRSMEILPTEG